MSRKIVRSSQAIGEIVDGELVLLNLETGVYFGLNRTGTRIWELLDEHADLDALELALAKAYPTAPDTLRQDLERLIQELEGAGLVHELST